MWALLQFQYDLVHYWFQISEDKIKMQTDSLCGWVLWNSNISFQSVY
jgi:hypothetical protein